MRLDGNYLVIAPPTLECSTGWNIQASVSHGLSKQMSNRMRLAKKLCLVAPPKLKCSTEWIDHLTSMNWNIQQSVTSWTVQNK